MAQPISAGHIYGMRRLSNHSYGYFGIRLGVSSGGRPGRRAPRSRNTRAVKFADALGIPGWLIAERNVIHLTHKCAVWLIDASAATSLNVVTNRYPSETLEIAAWHRLDILRTTSTSL
jgi:hypothetical protein